MFDPIAFKQNFPLFAQTENRDLVYLDNAATTQRPAAVIAAIGDFYTHSNANTHRSSHRLARAATAMLERTRGKAARFLGAAEAAELVFCRGATEGLNLLANSLCQQLRAGDEILLTRAEHHANLVPWQLAAQRHDLRLCFVDDEGGVPDMQALASQLSERTRIVSVTAASNALGFATDLRGLAALLGARDIRLVVDAAQLAAHQPIDVQQIGCDFLVCSAHKFYGPTGIGLLYGRRALLDMLPVWQGGGEMIERVELQRSEFAPAPYRFEAGTCALAAIAGLEAVLDFWQLQDRAAMQRHEQQLLQRLHQGLAELNQLRLLTRATGNVGIAAFVPRAESRWAASDIAQLLDAQDIALRLGQHCAQPLMALLGCGASLRASLAAYNTEADIERLLAALRALLASAPAVAARAVGQDNLQGLDLAQLHTLQQWQQRYRLLMQWSVRIAAKPALRSEENRVRGCESNAWLSHRRIGDGHYFLLDSDARVVKGLGVILLLLLNGRSREQIEALDLEGEFAALGLDKHLSPSRSNGFRALLERALDCVRAA